MKRVLLTVLGLAALVVPGTAAAQAQGALADSSARRVAMDRLSFLEGDWTGDAWVAQGPGRRLELRQEESVRRKVGGQILLVEGVGRRLTDGVPGDTAFNAVGVIDWAPDGGYRMRSYILSGQRGDFPLTLADSGFAWGYDQPRGRVRYTMRLTPEGRWHEVGEYSPDGQRWFPVFEMTLTRRQAAGQ
jgi:hypothetical protein